MRGMACLKTMFPAKSSLCQVIVRKHLQKSFQNKWKQMCIAGQFLSIRGCTGGCNHCIVPQIRIFPVIYSSLELHLVIASKQGCQLQGLFLIILLLRGGGGETTQNMSISLMNPRELNSLFLFSLCRPFAAALQTSCDSGKRIAQTNSFAIRN